MPVKGSKKLNEKHKFIGENARNKKEISNLESILNEQEKKVKSLQDKIRYRQKQASELKEKLMTIENDSTTPLIAVSEAKRKRRLENPTSFLGSLSTKAKQRRTTETLTVCQAIHGATNESKVPLIDGMLMALSRSTKSAKLANKMINCKESVKKELSQNLIKEHNVKFYKSHQNLLRSLNVYYAQEVMGKRKYSSVRKANKVPEVPNLLPFEQLSRHINSIDIGQVNDICPKFTHDLLDEEIGGGSYRNLIQYIPRLAKMYLKLNLTRKDKLLDFKETFTKKNPESFLFLLAVGGDEAPVAGTSFLISFLNIGKFFL